MKNPAETPRSRSAAMSAEALVGLGMTVFSLGVLFLLLGWAQAQRQVHDASLILLSIGAILFVLGGFTALLGRSRNKS